jgi:hypothetical protein
MRVRMAKSKASHVKYAEQKRQRGTTTTIPSRLTLDGFAGYTTELFTRTGSQWLAHTNQLSGP